MVQKGVYNLAYGMYVLTVREEGRDYGCLVNTAMEVSRNPGRIAVCLAKRNLTCDVLQRTGIFNFCALTEAAPYDIFRRFGMTSSRKAEKFADCPGLGRSSNGLAYLTDFANMYLSARVVESVDLGDHILFISQITEDVVLSDAPTCTLDYFSKHIQKSGVS